MNVSDCFDRTVEQNSALIALDCFPENKRIRYDELKQLVSAVGNKLIKSLSKRSEKATYNGVVLCVEEGLELVVLIMALAYAGMFYVPVELSKTPTQRLDFISKDCDASYLIAWKQDKEKVPTNIEFIAADDILDITTEEPSLEVQQSVSDSSTPLYAIYTSGSTGEPKGVMMNHGNLCVYSKMKAHDEGIHGGNAEVTASRVLLASAFTFDLCQGDIYTTLLNGGTLIIAPRSALLNDLRFVLTKTETTHITLTPSLFGLLDANVALKDTEEDAKTVQGPRSLPQLRSVCLGGEPMSKHLIETWGSSPNHNLILRNLYGATEATVHQTRAVIKCDGRANDVGTPIGYSLTQAVDYGDMAMGSFGVGVFLAADWHLGDNSFSIVKPPLREEAYSHPAEIVICGPTVAKSYLNRPKLSALKFPVTSRFGQVFRSGDLGRWATNSQGEVHLELIGRMEDGLVKVNGQRVESGEVVSALETAEVVKNAVVIKSPSARSDHNLVSPTSGVGESLTALLILEEGEVLDEHLVCALVALCELLLPPHMVPRRFGVVVSQANQFPLTSSGKVDHRTISNLLENALNEEVSGVLDTQGMGGSNFQVQLFMHPPSEPPCDHLERSIAAVWEEVLGISQGTIGRGDSFTTLGGDSLAALRASRLLVRRTTVLSGEVIPSAVGAEQGLVDGEAALYLNAAIVQGEEGDACLFGVTMGPRAPCELEAHPVLQDYSHFLRRHNVIPLSSKNDNYEQKPSLLAFGGKKNSIIRAMSAAASTGRLRLVETLLKVDDFEKEAPTVRYFTPIHAAVTSLHPDALTALKLITTSKKGVGWAKTPTHAGTTALHLCAARAGEVAREMAVVLLSSQVDLLAQDADDCTALHLASRVGDHTMVELLLNHHALSGGSCACGIGVDSRLINCLDRWGRSALVWAVLNNKPQVFRCLVEHGADSSSALCEAYAQSIDASRIGNAEEFSDRLNQEKPGHGSGDPAHVLRKRASDVDMLQLLLTIIVKFQQTNVLEELSDLEAAISTVRNLVCTSNKNRETARKIGLIPKLVDIITQSSIEMSFGKYSRALKLNIAAAGTLRNLGYGNENNRIAMLEAGAVEALLQLLPRDGRQLDSVQGEARNLLFTVASGLCNLAMSSACHAVILAHSNALSVIEAVFGVGGHAPHPGLNRLQSSRRGMAGDSPLLSLSEPHRHHTTSRYTDHRAKKVESDQQLLENSISVLKQFEIRFQDEDTVEVTAALNTVSTIVKSNNRRRELAHHLGAIPVLVSLLQRLLSTPSTSKHLLARFVEALGCLSFGNDANRLAIAAAGGVPVLMKFLPLVHSDIDNAENLALMATNTLCNLAMNHQIRQEIAGFPSGVLAIERVAHTLKVSHPGLVYLGVTSQ